MALDWVGAVKPLAQALVKVLGLIDPKTRDWVRKRKALDWAEKYIFTKEEIDDVRMIKPFTDRERKTIKRLEKKLGYYRKWFFDYS